MGTLGVGGSVIRFDGFLTSSAATLSPAVRFDSPRLSLAGQGSWTVFESGNDVLQGTVGGAWLAGSARTWRLELSGSGGASRYATEPAAGHLLGGARFHLVGRRSGGWLGAGAGATFGDRAAGPVEVSLAGWTVTGQVALVGAATHTWLDGDRYLDLLGALRWTARGVEVEGRLGVRPWSESPERAGDPVTGVFGELTAQVPLGRRLTLSLGGGSYPSQPSRRVLGATYLSAGLRLRAFGRGAVADPLFDAGLRSRRGSVEEPASARLEIAPAGPGRRIRVQAPGARVVELMGDFTDWETVPLVEVAPGVWEVVLPISPGVHRLNLRVDGGSWLAPAGTRAEANEFGGVVGVVVVR